MKMNEKATGNGTQDRLQNKARMVSPWRSDAAADEKPQNCHKLYFQLVLHPCIYNCLLQSTFIAKTQPRK